jgi:protein-L-isoaspartate(D-aspartate) O-methyltransferase
MRWKALVAALALGLPGCGREPPREPPAQRPPGAAAATPPAAPASTRPVSAALAKARSERVGERDAMIAEALVAQGVRDPVVLRAMRDCPRHAFVPQEVLGEAYGNRPLPIGEDQTISQPTVVGSMTEELRLLPTSRVLEIGTGSGYQAAVLAEITPHVLTIEIKAGLAARAERTLRDLGYASVRVRHGDGYHGWPEEAPFDAILVTAAAPHVPPPLVRQLKPGGRLVIPIGPPFQRQDLVLVEKDEDGRVRTRSLYGVAFVPLTGSLGREGD